MVVKMQLYIPYFLSAVIVTCCITESACSMWCYSCTYTRNAEKKGAECMTVSWNVTTASKVKCHHPKKCTTQSVYKHTTQEMQSFHRGCTVDMGNYCRKDNNYDTCYTSCDSDYCNHNDGDPVTKRTNSLASFVCYGCVHLPGLANNTASCVTEPWNVTAFRRDMVCYTPQLCTIERQILHTPTGILLYSFKRACTDYKVNLCTKHDMYEVCSTSCRGDYCNDGDGIPSGSTGMKMNSHFIGITVSMGILRQYLFN